MTKCVKCGVVIKFPLRNDCPRRYHPGKIISQANENSHIYYKTKLYTCCNGTEPCQIIYMPHIFPDEDSNCGIQ